MEYLDKIEDYINQTLSNEERISFEKECATNSKLAEELAFYLKAKETLYLNQREVLNKRYYQNQTTTNTSIIQQLTTQFDQFLQNVFLVQDIRYQLSFATVLLVLGFGIWQLFPNPQSAYQTYAELAKAQEAPLFLISETTMSDDTSESVIEQALEAGANKDYSQALALVDTLAESTPKYYKVLEIKGLYHYQLGNYQQSIDAFEKYINQPDGQFKNWANWYQALAYLQLEDGEKARKKLEILLQNERFKQRTEQLLDNLNKIK